MAAVQLRTGDTNTEFLITVKDQEGVVVDLTGATLALFIRKPGGAVLTRTPTLKTTGTDGKMHYFTQAGDLDVAGEYTMQGRVNNGSGVWTSDEFRFTVLQSLA